MILAICLEFWVRGRWRTFDMENNLLPGEFIVSLSVANCFIYFNDLKKCRFLIALHIDDVRCCNLFNNSYWCIIWCDVFTSTRTVLTYLTQLGKVGGEFFDIRNTSIVMLGGGHSPIHSSTLMARGRKEDKPTPWLKALDTFGNYSLYIWANKLLGNEQQRAVDSIQNCEKRFFFK